MVSTQRSLRRVNQLDDVEVVHKAVRVHKSADE